MLDSHLQTRDNRTGLLETSNSAAENTGGCNPCHSRFNSMMYDVNICVHILLSRVQDKKVKDPINRTLHMAIYENMTKLDHLNSNTQGHMASITPGHVNTVTSITWTVSLRVPSLSEDFPDTHFRLGRHGSRAQRQIQPTT